MKINFQTLTQAERELIHQRLQGSQFTYDDFKEWLGWPETDQRLTARFGKDWTLEQALDYVVPVPPPRMNRSDGLRPMQEQEQNQDEDEDKEEQRADVEAIIGQEEFQRRVQERVAAYESEYQNITPNDRAAVRDLASAEVSSEVINLLLSKELTSPKPNGQTISRYTYALKGLSEQARATQRMLAIDRAAREREARKRSDVDKVLEVIDEAGAWAEENAIKLEHCNILYGMLLLDFREIRFEVTWTCPKCNTIARVEHVPTEEDLRAREPEWVAEEEQDYRKQEERKHQDQAFEEAFDSLEADEEEEE